MPTGYTSYIKDGKITSGKEFLKLFGEFWNMNLLEWQNMIV